MSADARAWLDTTLPLDDVGSTRIELAGRFAEYVDRVRSVTDRLDGSRPLADWLERAGRRHRRADPGRPRRRLAGRPGAARAGRRGRRRRHPRRHRAAAARRPGAARLPPRRPSHPRQLPHRHADGLHDGADALGPAPGGVPARPRRRRVPAVRAGRRRRRTRPAAGHRRARRPQRGPPAALRRDPGRHRVAGGDLHRRQRAHRAAAATRRTARRGARRARPDHRRPGPRRSWSWSTRCSRSTASNLEPGRLGTDGPFTFDPTALVAARAAAGTRPPQPGFLAGPLALADGRRRRRWPTCWRSSATR